VTKIKKNVCKRWIKNVTYTSLNPKCLRPNRTASNYTTKFCSFFLFRQLSESQKMSVECSTSVFAAHWILHSRNLREKWKMYYIIKLYYFVAVLSLTYTPICQRFLKIKNVTKMKNVKNVFYINVTDMVANCSILWAQSKQKSSVLVVAVCIQSMGTRDLRYPPLWRRVCVYTPDTGKIPWMCFHARTVVLKAIRCQNGSEWRLSRMIPTTRSLLHARRYTSAVFAVSVRPSVTIRRSSTTAKSRVMRTTPYDSPGSLVFDAKKSKGVAPNGVAK